MTIELDTTLAQAEVLFLSFTQLVADMDRRVAEENVSHAGQVWRRVHTGETTGHRDDRPTSARPLLSEELRSLLPPGRR